MFDNQNSMEMLTKEGDSPVRVKKHKYLSKARHVKPCLNMGGPPSKPKYSLMTDSEQVP